MTAVALIAHAPLRRVPWTLAAAASFALTAAVASGATFEGTIRVPRTGEAALGWSAGGCKVRGVSLRNYPSAEDIQNIVYEVGKAGGFDSLRDWFKALYETLLGSSQGPRMGSFIALYGVANSRKLIAEALAK